MAADLERSTLIEHKGPTDELEREDILILLSYAYQYMRLAKVYEPRELCLMTVSDRVTPRFLRQVDRCGGRLEELEAGLWHGTVNGFTLHGVETGVIAQRRPSEHLLYAFCRRYLEAPEGILPLNEEEFRVYMLLYQRVEQFKKMRGAMAPMIAIADRERCMRTRFSLVLVMCGFLWSGCNDGDDDDVTLPPEESPSPSDTPTPTSSPEPTPTSSPEPTPTSSPAPTPTSSPAPTPTSSPEPTPTSSPEPTPTSSPEPTPTPAPVDDDGDGHPVDQDCDDGDPTVFPGALETPYDGVDQDCSGGDLEDVDEDGERAEEVGGPDCDDRDPDISSGALEVPYDGVDQDCTGSDLTDQDRDEYDAEAAGGPDCDDLDLNTYPGAAEIGDGRDNDCDGRIDEDLDTTDDDGDQISDGDGDCNDYDPDVYPGAVEIPYDGVDQDCSGQDLIDVDGDSYPSTDVAEGTDCDDENAAIHPAAQEVCDGIDNNCDGILDLDAVDRDTYHRDADGDGYGDPAAAVRSCSTFTGYVADNTDCDDASSSVHPGAAEACDGVDNDCDGQIDDGVKQRYYRDEDEDGYGDAGVWVEACTAPEGYLEDGTDCDDTDDTVYPGAPEVVNGLDDDCDEVPDDGIDFSSCRSIKVTSPDSPSGIYTVDPDGTGAASPFQVYCEMSLDGGGWQLISVRHKDSGALFSNAVCTATGADCSGTIPAAQVPVGSSPDLLFATVDGVYWLRMTGLAAPGANALLDVITLKRALTDSSSCSPPHYCGSTPDPNLKVHSTSSNFTARYTILSSQYSRLGGIWFGNGGGSEVHHVVSLNYSAYCGVGGFDLSKGGTSNLGNVVCGKPGALYFRY